MNEDDTVTISRHYITRLTEFCDEYDEITNSHRRTKVEERSLLASQVRGYFADLADRPLGPRAVNA